MPVIIGPYGHRRRRAVCFYRRDDRHLPALAAAGDNRKFVCVAYQTKGRRSAIDDGGINHRADIADQRRHRAGGGKLDTLDHVDRERRRRRAGAVANFNIRRMIVVARYRLGDADHKDRAGDDAGVIILRQAGASVWPDRQQAVFVVIRIAAGSGDGEDRAGVVDGKVGARIGFGKINHIGDSDYQGHIR